MLRPRPRVPLTRTIPGPRPSGRLHLSKFDPVEFVLARAKTILPGAKLDACQRARQGTRQGWRGSKEPKKHVAPEPPNTPCASHPPRRSPNSPGANMHPFGGMEVHRTSMNAPPYPRAQTRGSLLPIPAAVLGCAIRGLEQLLTLPGITATIWMR